MKRRYVIFITVCMLLSIMMATVGCESTETIGDVTIVTKDGMKYIDCSAFAEEIYDPSDGEFAILEIVRPVMFATEEEMLHAIRNYSFTDEQKQQMAYTSSGKLFGLPTKSQTTKLTISSNRTLKGIGWLGEDYFIYYYSIPSGEGTVELIYYPKMDEQSAEEFIAEKDEQTANSTLTVYTENGIEYTKRVGTPVIEMEEKYFQRFYWSYTIGQTTYYVYQHKRAVSESLLESSPYTIGEIVIKDNSGYHRILINDTSALSITPEFLEQLQVVGVSLGNEIK